MYYYFYNVIITLIYRIQGNRRYREGSTLDVPFNALKMAKFMSTKVDHFLSFSIENKKSNF